MAGVTPQRQFHGSCILVQHQLHRVGESFELEECYAAGKAKGMLKDEEIAFINDCLALDEAGSPEVGPNGVSLEEAIKRLQYLVSSRMNLGDCA